MLKICLYSPYFPKHLGGGEKYLLDAAQGLAAYGEVSLAVPEKNLTTERKEKIYEQYERFMGQDLRQLQLISTPLGTSANWKEKLWWTRQFDLIYYITDGSLFFSLARRNVMHVQTPLRRAPLVGLEQLKRLNWQFVNTNSAFTRQIVEKHWQLPVNAVHYPLINILHHQQLAERIKKENVILHVGRFFRQQHNKKQEVLVRFFAKLRQEFPRQSKGWRLVLIGSVEDEAYAKSVQRLAKGLPIKIIHQISREDLNRWYAKASIYWHATGYGQSESEAPEKMEHFGISTVEAMASGAVPIVIDKGGQPEAVGPELRPWLWQDEKTCLAKTVEVMNNKRLRERLSRAAQLSSQRFGPQAFDANLRQMLRQLELI